MNMLCHNGAINVCFKYDSELVTAGQDGKIKFWDDNFIDQSEADDYGNCLVRSNKTIQIWNDKENQIPANIIDIIPAEQGWIVIDSLGKLTQLDSQFQQQDPFLTTNSGTINDVALGYLDIAICIGQDGTVRLQDYVQNKQIYERTFAKQGTCVEWVPYTFSKLHSGRVVITGFSNGICRWLLLNQNGFYLLKTMKVHKEAIKFIKCSPSGDIVCITDEQGDMFFIQQNPNDLQIFEPFCFFETGLKINDFKWDKHGENIIIGADDGSIYQIQVPKKSDCQTDETYLQNFEPQKWTIKMMEFQKPKTEEMDLEFLLKRNKNEDKKDQEWEPQSIMNVAYINDQIACTVQGSYLGYIYFIDFNEERPTKAVQISKATTINLSVNQNQDVLTISYADGRYQLYKIADFESFSEIQTHDKDYGKVKKALVSNSNNAVVSVSEDGTLYTYKFDYQNFINFDPNIQGLYNDFENPFTTSSFADQVNLVETTEEDIVDDQIYSIQQAKIKADEDYRKKEADKRKEKVLEIVQDLQDKYNQLQQKNQEIEEIARLDEEEMVVDEQYQEELRNRVKEDMDETNLQLKYDYQKYARELEKLKEVMMDELEHDRFGVTTIKEPKKTVFTFKIKKLSKYVQDQLREIYMVIESTRIQQEEYMQEQEQPKILLNDTIKQGTGAATLKVEEKQVDQTSKQNPDEEEFVPPEGLTGAKVEKARHKWEEQKIRRQLELLEATNPSKESTDPELLKEIAQAQENIGDYKLKSDKNYNVPENQRVNDHKKRQHIFLLEEYIHNVKLRFNNEIITIREFKQDIIEKSQIYNKRIEEINKQLGMKETLFTPNLDNNIEAPEKNFDITEEQIDEFQKQKEKEALAKNKKGGMGMGGDDKKQQKQAETKTESKKKESIVAQFKKRQMKTENTELEGEMKNINQMILIAEKSRMQNILKEDIEEFDQMVLKFIREKNEIESDLVRKQMKLTTYYQELLILQNMKTHDDQLNSALTKIKVERKELDEKSNKITEQLQALNNDEKQVEAELQEYMKVFKTQVHPDDENKREKIHQYYLRKHKKIQAKQLKIKNSQEEDDYDEDEDQDSEEDEDDDDDFLDDDDDEKPDISQVDGDPAIKANIDKICEAECKQEQTRKEKMEFERTKSQLHQKAQLIRQQLSKAEQELKAYQRKKLNRVNQLDVSYCLKLNQIKNGNQNNNGDYELPNNLDESILFTQANYDQLGARKEELEREQDDIKNKKKKFDKKKKNLDKQIAIKEKESADLNKKLTEKHQLKFGDFIDLKILDALEPTQEVLDMKEKFKKEEIAAIKNIEKAKRSLLDKKKQLLEIKKDNTKIITKITKLGTQKMNLDQKLDQTNKQLLKEENEEKKYKNDLQREHQNLKDLVRFLSKEIEDLKTEIGLFKRKGGHIYTMVTSNKK